jgi:GH24 family phage-related lysozyme (muramidase)
MVISDSGIDFIKQREAFRSGLYNDPAGHCTIGYGTLVHRGNCNGSEPEEYRAGIAEERATELLRREIGRIETIVNTSVTVPLNQPQFDALVSFAYNAGTGAFKRSTLLRKLNEGNTDAVPAELKNGSRPTGRKWPAWSGGEPSKPICSPAGPILRRDRT